MLKAKVIVDLPSEETDRKMKVTERFRSWFGAKIDLRSGWEELTVGGMMLLQGIVAAFRKAGINNAISLLIDKQVIFKDTDEEEDDLPLIIDACQAAGVFERSFNEMHLVLTHNDSGIHLLADVRIINQVVLGEAEMTVSFAGRIEELRIKKGESAAEYGERIKVFTENENAGEGWRLIFHQQVEKVAQALRDELVGAEVSMEAARIELIKPGQQQIGNFRHLGFKDQIKEPKYRPAPTRHRDGAYADPFYYYYYDPYYDFMTFMMLSNMMHYNHWHSTPVYVVDATGQDLSQGGTIPAGEVMSGQMEIADPVSFDESGDLVVADQIPEVAAPSASDVETGADGWGGAEAADLDSDKSSWFGEDNFGGADIGSSCGSSFDSSCGSSCSSCSSCGSSCGGCGGCGGY